MKPGNAAPTPVKASPPVKDTALAVATAPSKKTFTAPKLFEKSSLSAPPTLEATAPAKKSISSPKIFEKPSPIAPNPVLSKVPATPVSVLKAVEKKENQAKSTVPVKAAPLNVKSATPSFFSFMKLSTSTKSSPPVKDAAPPVSASPSKKSFTAPKLFEKPSLVTPKPVLSKVPPTPVSPKTVEKKVNQDKVTKVPVPVKAAAVAAPSFLSFMKPGNAAPMPAKSSSSAKDTAPPVSTQPSKKSFTASKPSEKPSPRVPPVAQAPKQITPTKKTAEAPALTKPKSFGGMFNMEISKGKTGKNSASTPKK